jgi:N-acetylglucosaminyldiphosphoundecaprenol N-acetyl-beta-D-mannosaminyltransferase
MVAIPSFVVIGLIAARAPASTFRALALAPGFLAWKLLTYARLVRGFDASRWDRSDRNGEPSREDMSRIEIGGVPIDRVDLQSAIARLRAAIGGPALVQVSTVNLDFVVRAQHEPEIMRIFHQSDLNLADGAPVVWLGRLLGARMPGRVAGADLVPALLAEAARMGARVFLLGGENGVAGEAAARLVAQNPNLIVAGFYEPPRAAVEEMDNADILDRIRRAGADILLVALGHPKQEHWIHMHRDSLQVSVAIGVGCVFDLIAGRNRRAPRWMQLVGLEWVFRLVQEPRRLWRRYLNDAAWLIPITATALRQRLAPHVVEVA